MKDTEQGKVIVRDVNHYFQEYKAAARSIIQIKTYDINLCKLFIDH